MSAISNLRVILPKEAAYTKKIKLMAPWMPSVQKRVLNSGHSNPSSPYSSSQPGAINCKYRLKIGSAITLPGNVEGIVTGFLGKGAYKLVYLIEAGDQKLAITCTRNSEQVRRENKRIADLLKKVRGLPYSLLPSQFNKASIGSKQFFCQTAKVFDTSLNDLNALLNKSLANKQTTHYCIQIGDDGRKKKALPFAFEMVLIHNIQEVGFALLTPKKGVLAHLKKHQIAHGDLHSRNLFVNTDKDGKIVDVALADWDLCTLEASKHLMFRDRFNAVGMLHKMPSITRIFHKPTKKRPLNSIEAQYLAFSKSIQKAKVNAKKQLRVPT